ncbi:MAG TPA: hypothetical protein PKC76_08660 [Saprospiraceae bacterium]|nr:hypothetical protein [Saprospiraceae bacterium]HMP24189.1 hypothetical protein [Saprospiraceae bacterium]
MKSEFGVFASYFQLDSKVNVLPEKGARVPDYRVRWLVAGIMDSAPETRQHLNHQQFH